MSEPILKDTLLRLAAGGTLAVGPRGADVLVVPGAPPVELTNGPLAVVEAFAVPRTLESGVRAVARRLPPGGPADALAEVLSLLDRGILTAGGAPLQAPPAAVRKRNRAGFFGCPNVPFEEALAAPAGVVFFGARYDLGVTGRVGARTGPTYLRTCSRTAFDYEDRDGRAVGWWHPSREARVLDGVPFRDVGDFAADRGRNGAMFDALFDAERSLLRRGHLPVGVGGDHSVSLPLITAAAREHPGLGVVQFDAHADLGAAEDMGEWRTQCTHGNFMSWGISTHCPPTDPTTSRSTSTASIPRSSRRPAPRSQAASHTRISRGASLTWGRRAESWGSTWWNSSPPPPRATTAKVSP